jgi:MerR family transcriptional regulator, light-induced transcriptional regulator
MTTIQDLPDDPKFTIKAVATKTGIRPVTLRAWERRHEVLNPRRADNRYRLYSERDIAILRWLKNRVDNGVSISSAAGELHSMTSNNIWPETIPMAPTLAGVASSTPPAQYAVELFQALIKHEENRAGDILREIHALFDLNTVFSGVLIPALRNIGEAWYRGEIRVTTEHFASAYLRGKLLSLLQAYPSRRSAPFVLIGCAPMEQHELGSLMLSVLLRSEGYRVEFLGPDVPVEDLADYASYEQPAMVILSASSEYSAREMKRMQKMLSKQRKSPIFGYGGRAFDFHPELRNEIAGIYLGNSLETAMITIKDLLKSPQKAAV